MDHEPRDGEAEGSVGVVIPAHNRPDGLRRALDSVLGQRPLCARVVVVDDGSASPVGSWLECADRRVTVVRNERAVGPAAARNQGVDLLDTEWVGFLDDDDRWLDGKVERCLRSLDQHPHADLLVHRAGLPEQARDQPEASRVVTDPVRWMLARQPPHVDCVLVRRAAHERVRFDESYRAAADLDYMVRLAGCCTVVEVPEVLAVHGSAPSASALSLSRRIAAREQFHAAHRSLFRDPELEAVHRVRLGHLRRRAGQRAHALKAFAGAVRIRPRHPGAWKGLVVSAMPRRLVARVSRS